MRKRMLVTVPSLAATAFVIYVVPALAVTDPGQGTAPPTAGAILTTGANADGIFAQSVGGGGGGQGHMKLLWSLGACVVAASASALVGALA